MPHPDRLPLFHVIGFVGQDPLPNPVEQLALFKEWVPDAAAQRAVLVENAARLYGF
mgnify:CR=1 FL=1